MHILICVLLYMLFLILAVLYRYGLNKGKILIWFLFDYLYCEITLQYKLVNNISAFFTKMYLFYFLVVL